MRSMERQLQIGLALILIIVMGLLWVVGNMSTRIILQEFVTSRLQHDAENIVETIAINGENTKIRWRRINSIYHTPFSGHYYQINIANNSAPIRSESLQGLDLEIPSTSLNMPLSQITSGPQGQQVMLWVNRYIKQGQEITIAVAEDMSYVRKQRQKFKWLIAILAGSGAILMLVMQHLIIRRLFQRLDKIRDEVRQLQSGKTGNLSEQVPIEIHPLVKELNHLLALMQHRLERSRNSLGNLAHALKGPLNLLVQNLDDNKPDHHQARLHVERIHQLTERELKRARMAGTGPGNSTQRFDPRGELPILIKVLRQTHQCHNLEIELDIASDVPRFGDREDMLELIGNLLDNACKWANSRVNCKITISQNILISIEDDGANRSEQEFGQLSERGVRLDETVDGHGLGLAICLDIVKLYGGTIEFDRSPKLGGFRARVTLPY